MGEKSLVASQPWGEARAPSVLPSCWQRPRSGRSTSLHEPRSSTEAVRSPTRESRLFFWEIPTPNPNPKYLRTISPQLGPIAGHDAKRS